MRTEMLTPHYGFIVDYLSDLWRILRGSSFANALDRFFRLGPALDRRDDKAVRRTTSGLLKLVFPHGEFEANDVRWALELAMEMRRSRLTCDAADGSWAWAPDSGSLDSHAAVAALAD